MAAAVHKAGRPLTWAEAVAEFRDTTGQPAPATWKNGTYPDGEADYPVTGISWYEAAAYAEFVGKRLPSLYHWSRAAAPWLGEFIIPLSNFAGRGFARVGSYQGISSCGAYDMAGNAKEWCWNEASQGQRHILGGGWREPGYMFLGPDAQSPFDRSLAHGFRCMKLSSTHALAKGVDGPALPVNRNYANEKPVSDDVFRTPMPTSFYRDHVVQWSKDLGRSIDYLETRKDVQPDKVVYYGFSWGASLGALLPAVENRLKANVLVGGGFYVHSALPEVAQINFAPRVTIPTLMLNGKYDCFYPLEATLLPMFRLLGTPSEQKRHVIFDSGHIPPQNQFAEEILAWLDRYLGRVK